MEAGRQGYLANAASTAPRHGANAAVVPRSVPWVVAQPGLAATGGQAQTVTRSRTSRTSAAYRMRSCATSGTVQLTLTGSSAAPTLAT